MNNVANKPRTIKSFVRREGRLTKSQRHALEFFWKKHGIDYSPELLDLEKTFHRRAPLIMDIGVGTGDTTLNHAWLHPENDYLAIDVHRPGIGHLLNRLEINEIKNVKIINHDVIQVLKDQIPDHSISQIFIFFPDPWPKKRHHKRRLINESLLGLIKQKLTWHGRLHIATDWSDYAEHISAICNDDPGFINLSGRNNFAPRPDWRVNTRYETRGRKLNHDVRDFCFGLVQNIKSSKE